MQAAQHPHDTITAYIGLGANLDDRGANLRLAVEQLDSTDGTRILRVSKFLENSAVGGPEGSPDYLNAVAAVETTLTPIALLHRLLDIERGMGRFRSQKNAPRPIDLDLILYGDEVIDAPDLQIPHPLMHERRFVLQPLTEIAPDVMHPLLKRTAAEMLEALR